MGPPLRYEASIASSLTPWGWAKWRPVGKAIKAVTTNVTTFTVANEKFEKPMTGVTP
jgi:hypothetical protein